ncbi:MAG: response regulator [Adhaeribacter sp.]
MKRLSGIFLIDDNETSNFLNERLIRRMNLTDHILVFSNGRLALDYLENLSRQIGEGGGQLVKPELILLDINMPVLDGFEFLQLFQHLDARVQEGIQIAMLSTSNHPQDTGKAGEFKAYYLTKPLTLEKMETLLAQKFAGVSP